MMISKMTWRMFAMAFYGVHTFPAPSSQSPLFHIEDISLFECLFGPPSPPIKKTTDVHHGILCGHDVFRVRQPSFVEPCFS
eukprot:1334588-Amphidinium_carterae.1